MISLDIFGKKQECYLDRAALKKIMFLNIQVGDGKSMYLTAITI